MKTNEEKNLAIYEAYVNGEKVKDIAERFGVAATYVSKKAKQMGATPRNKPRTKAGKHCPKCRKQIDVKGAKYCCFCGADIRSEQEILIERIYKALEVVGWLPQNARDETQKTLLDVIEVLKEDGFDSSVVYVSDIDRILKEFK